MELYCDGGLIGRNPSPHGGTWCWTLVNSRGKRVKYESGLILPREMGKKQITNNESEMYAVIKGLESVTKDWDGRVYTDSRVTFHRLVNRRGIPSDWMKRLVKALNGRELKMRHIGGHPSRLALERGYDKRGLLVSAHNVFCDKMCQEEARKYKEGIACTEA